MELNRENMRKLRQLIVFTIIVLIILWNFKLVWEVILFIWNIIFPFLLGGAIAFIINVPMHFLEKKLFGGRKAKENKLLRSLARPVSLALTLCFAVGIIVLVAAIVVPELGTTISSLGKSIQTFMPQAMDWLLKTFEGNKELEKQINSLNVDWQNILDSIISFLKSGAGDILGTTVDAAMGIISGVSTFAVGFVFACYILMQKEKLGVQGKKILYAYLPEKHAKSVLYVCSLTYKTFSNFLTGQCLEAVILGLMFVVVLSIAKIPYAMLIGVLVAFTALIPIFGAFIGCIVGAFLILTVNPLQALEFVIIFLILQQIEGNLIYPRVVGSSVGLPSIWVLAAVTIGASLMGVVGMLVFIPLASVLYALFRENVYKRLDKKGIQNIE